MATHLMTANEAKTRFGEALLMSQREPVHITKHGKSVAVLLASDDFVATEELKLELLKLRAQQAKQEIAAGETVDGGSFFDELTQGSES